MITNQTEGPSVAEWKRKKQAKEKAAHSTSPAELLLFGGDRLLVPIIERPLAEQFKGRRHHSSGRIVVEWVNKLEKLNTNLETAGAPAGGQQTRGEHQLQVSARQNHHKQHDNDHDHDHAKQAAHTRAADGRHHSSSILIEDKKDAQASLLAKSPLDSNYTDSNDSNDDDERDLCLRASQLITEFLLMMFAASLLLIAAIVIFSRRVPQFMESYEIVPKFFFFLCLFVASYSFLRWLAARISQRCQRPEEAGGGLVEEEQRLVVTSKGSKEAETVGVEKAHQEEAKECAMWRASHQFSKSAKSLSEPLLESIVQADQDGVVTSKIQDTGARVTINKLDSPPSGVVERQTLRLSCPPTRQVSFESFSHLSALDNLRPDHEDTIAEEEEEEEVDAEREAEVEEGARGEDEVAREAGHEEENSDENEEAQTDSDSDSDSDSNESSRPPPAMTSNCASAN